MTIKVTAKCDASGCFEEIEMEGCDNEYLGWRGWFVHPDDDFQHFCSGCWPKVKKETETGEMG